MKKGSRGGRKERRKEGMERERQRGRKERGMDGKEGKGEE